MMANSAAIEVSGPASAVMHALATLPQTHRASINTVGSTVYDMGEWSAIVGEEYDDGSTLVIVDSFDSPDQAALTLFKLLVTLPYAMKVRAADADGVLAFRAAQPAA